MLKHTTAALAAAALTMGTAHAAHLAYYTVDLQPLNGSNVTGNAVLIVNSEDNTLRINVNAFNVEPGQDHLMHIHGRFDESGAPIDSLTPTLDDDADGDGYVEVLEGLPKYGDILLPLETQNDSLGLFAYTQTFDLSDDALFFSPVSGEDYRASDLFPLNFRELVIHGKTVATGEGIGTGGEVDGTGGYKTTLPVAAGEIVGVPEPGSLALLGLGGLALVRRRRA
ncbi:MAG: PEP-CTERM sorting domain-containing protein [Phycisphaeraceae bacterium]